MTVFGLGAATGLKYITEDQVAQWYFGNLFVPFGIEKMVAVDADGYFAGIFRDTLQDTLLISVHTVARSNHMAIVNEGFHHYLNKVHNIKSKDEVIL